MSLDSDNPRTPATEVTFPPFAFASAVGVFIMMGAASSLFGPLLDSFTQRFHLSLPSAGAAVSVYFVGATLGVLPGWLGLKRLHGRLVLIIALVAIAIGALGAALAHVWLAFLVSVFVIGLGFGALDISLNTLLARTGVEGRAHRLSVGNAGYGVGAVICPLVIIAVRPANFPSLFGALAVLAVVLSACNSGVHAPPLRTEPLQYEITRLKSQRRPILFTFIVAYVLYLAIETSASGWMATQVHAHYSASVGSLVTAGFWCGMALGRSVGGVLYRKWSDKGLVLGGLVLGVVACALANVTVVSLVTYPLLGLVIASIFPMGLLWYTSLCPHDSDGLSMLIFFMMIGGVAGPGLVSLAVGRFGVHVVPTMLVSYCALAFVVFASALRFRPLVVTSASVRST